jgi:hypothetical protein
MKTWPEELLRFRSLWKFVPRCEWRTRWKRIIRHKNQTLAREVLHDILLAGNWETILWSIVALTWQRVIDSTIRKSRIEWKDWKLRGEWWESLIWTSSTETGQRVIWNSTPTTWK